MTDSALDRFFAKVEVADCWSWTASLTDAGYGQFFPGDGRRWRAHRWIWEQLVGPIPETFEVDHLCRNRRCVNPDHLEPVTRRTNQGRGMSPIGRNMRRTHCSRGHEYNEANTYIYRDSGGMVHRQCLRCQKIRDDARSYRKGA